MKWTFEILQQEALKYQSRIAFCRGNRQAYNAARIKGYLDQICTHMSRPINLGEKASGFKWTNGELKNQALKYTTKNDFIKNNPNAYNTAARRGILSEICEHMPTRKKIPREKNPKLKWTVEKIKLEALKYQRRDEFKLKSSGAWDAAQSLGILEEVCLHMSYGTNTSRSEKSLFDIVQAIYPKTQKLIDRKVKIENKPYIKGFEIDIYVPELRKGIEFDGIYHHSFKFMRSQVSKKDWSDQDVTSYHELKDSWFALKGIQILHVKEEDWKKDQQGCIKRCFEFLGFLG
jgi:hypothetical protein